MEITVDFPDYEDGIEIDLGGLLVVNREKTEISEEQELTFVARHGKPVREQLEGNKSVKVAGSAVYTANKVEQLSLDNESEPAADPNPYTEPPQDEKDGE